MAKDKEEKKKKKKHHHKKIDGTKLFAWICLFIMIASVVVPMLLYLASAK